MSLFVRRSENFRNNNYKSLFIDGAKLLLLISINGSWRKHRNNFIGVKKSKFIFVGFIRINQNYINI